MTGRRLEAVPSSGPASVPAGRQPHRPTPLLRELLGRRLREARGRRRMTLRDVAAASDVSIGHLSQVERGLCEVSSEVLAAICRALGLPLAVLLRDVVVDLTVPVGREEDAARAGARTAGVDSANIEAGHLAGRSPVLAA
ncbi:helix-turn-helix domain-containing protein [Pseudokineococcus sp. 1T1Z-3]|uniref:helix-turn-helix domain-containing protein n=1 Tax=Pseudokineococcus sp. 1T1Z-3 TaxID=3132745 RepID=UPI003098A4BC